MHVVRGTGSQLSSERGQKLVSVEVVSIIPAQLFHHCLAVGVSVAPCGHPGSSIDQLLDLPLCLWESEVDLRAEGDMGDDQRCDHQLEVVISQPVCNLPDTGELISADLYEMVNVVYELIPRVDPEA